LLLLNTTNLPCCIAFTTPQISTEKEGRGQDKGEAQVSAHVTKAESLLRKFEDVVQPSLHYYLGTKRNEQVNMSSLLLVLLFGLIAESRGLSGSNKYQVNEPTRFKVNGNLGDVLGSSITLALRLGSSALVGCYSVSVGDAQQDQYSILSVAGFMIKEKVALTLHYPCPKSQEI
jgi:hypothetical protein